MAKTTKTRWIIAGSALLLYTALMVAWVLKWLPDHALNGCGYILMGLVIVLSKPSSSLPRWLQLTMGLGICLMGVGWLGMDVVRDGLSMVPMMLGSLTCFASLIALIVYTQRPHSKLPLVLTDKMRTKAGLDDTTDEQGPALQVVLKDAGQDRRGVMRCLLKLYDIAGTPRVMALIREAPTVLQTTASRREAEFVAAQLTECGARVDLVEVQ